MKRNAEIGRFTKPSMNGLNVFPGNNMELLALEFSKVIAEPLSSPLAPDVVVVQSRGMERWLSMQIALHSGICANVSFPFPDVFSNDIFSAFGLDQNHPSVFDARTMTFVIMKQLPLLIDEPGFEALKLYFGDKIENDKSFQMASRISSTFEQYLVFRPDMVLKWEEGCDDNWQATLWRKISSEGKGYLHRARLHRTFFKTIINHKVKPAGCPERVSIFGISYLPPFYMHIFSALSRLIPVNLFLMNPCSEYWGDIVSGHEMKKINTRYAHPEHEVDLHMEQGNRLLSSMGVMGRDFFSFILNMDCNVCELFKDNNVKGMLSSIQMDILHLVDRDLMDTEAISEQDTSVQIHLCHSPMREIEVLHDHLLSFFEQVPGLLPKDIIVMAPDIELYSPFIDAVFNTQADSLLRIPYTIADQRFGTHRLVIDAFMLILCLKDTRFEVSHVMDVLEALWIRQRFGLDASDMDVIKKWIADTNIRWGIDDKHRINMGLPGFHENTWKAGIERMLLGYAMPGYGSNMFSGILPYDDIEGKHSNILGKFLDFLYALFECIQQMDQSRTLTQWHDYLHFTIDRFFKLDDMASVQMQVIIDILDGLVLDENLSGFDTKIEFKVIKSYILGHLEKANFDHGFLSGGVTFCSTLPMRSIPFTVICLIGMNNEDFPRNTLSPGFDLIAKEPKLLDRSKRNDDKYLFLEAIISAREKLYISYIGQDIRDNTQRLPSVLVSELLDYILKGFYIKDKQIGEHVLKKHKLQAYAKEYFTPGSGFFSYSKENADACRAFCCSSDKKKDRLFISSPFAPVEDQQDCTGVSVLNVDTLSGFFSNPAKYILENRLEVFFKQRPSAADETEEFQLDGLETYVLGSDLVENCLSGKDMAEFFPVYTATGQLPHGSAGNVTYRELSVDARFFADTVQRLQKGRLPDQLYIDLNVSDIKLSGTLDGIYDDVRVDFVYAKHKAKHVLRSWVYHLVFCFLTGSQSVLLCKDAVIKFDYVENSLNILKELICIYKKGMLSPLCFFPESSFEYACKHLNQGKTEQSALDAAQTRWAGNDYIKGESENPYYQRCFGDLALHETPLTEEFKMLAEKIFGPVFFDCFKKK